ncbi:MAG: ABC transporter permease subunit [Acidobacteria bacterium]|nr:ABC transporter permease subunit [Acidobacteriota bacterium]HPN16269.1 ABC transporter permease subunit [Candidatus Aminicenantes bacterium]
MKRFAWIAAGGLLAGACLSCSPAGKPAGVASLEDLKTARFGVVSGTVADQIVLNRFPEATFGYYPSPLDACLAVLKGKETAAAYDEPILRNIQAQNPGLKILPEMISVDQYAMAVRPDDRELKDAADALLAELRADGRYDEMKARWFPEKGKPAPMPEMAWEAPNGILDFGTCAVTEPFSFIDDSRRVVGFDVELASRLARRLGRELRIHNMEFGAMIPSLLSGKTDLIAACITVTEERAKSVLFTEPVYRGGIAAAVRDSAVAGAAPAFSGLADVAEKRIAVMVGSTHDKHITANFPRAEILRMDNAPDMLAALKSGKCEAAIFDANAGRLYREDDPSLAVLAEKIFIENLGFGFADVRLRDAFNAFLGELRATGELDEIRRKWEGDDGAAAIPDLPEGGENGRLRIATTTVDIPFSYTREEKPCGIDLELALRFAARQGLKPQIQPLPFASLIAAVASGKADLICDGITITEERAKQVAFSDAYYQSAADALTLKEHLDGGNRPEETGSKPDIAEAVIGAMTGSTGEALVRERFPRAGIHLFDDVMDAVAALKARKVDYVITAYTTALQAARANPDLAVLPEEYNQAWAAIAVHKDNPRLLERINAVLEEMRDDGTLEEIISHWVRPDGSPYVKTEVPRASGWPALRVAVAANREPMGFIEDNKIVGLDPELIERIAFKLGRPVVFTDMKFSALIAALESGKADVVCSNLTATEERRRRVAFSEGYYVNPQVMMTLKDRPPAAGAALRPSWPARLKKSFVDNIIREKRYLLIWNGLKVTALIAVLSALLGTLLGALICLMRMGRNRALKAFAKAYISLLRGIPQVVLLMLMFYVVFAPLDVSGVAVAIFTFALNFAAYVSEMFRAGIESVKRGQVEAGVAMGFSRFRTFVHIVLPQAVQRILPVFKGEFVALVKMTAIVGYIAVQDLTKASDIIRSRTFDAFFPLVMVAVLYFILAWGLTSLLEMIRVRVNPKRRRP